MCPLCVGCALRRGPGLCHLFPSLRRQCLIFLPGSLYLGASQWLDRTLCVPGRWGGGGRQGRHRLAEVFNCFGQHFCLHFEAFSLGMSPVYMAFLRFMGEDSDAKNFSYSLEVGGNRRKLAWQGIPRSIRDGYQKIRDSYDGLVIHRNIALFFSGGSRQELRLRVTGRIWRNIE